MKQVILFFLMLSGPFLHGQGLFDSVISEGAEQGISNPAEFSGYIRGSAFAGTDAYDFSNMFAESGFRVKFNLSNAFAYTDVRLRSGIQYGEEVLKLELKEAYAGFSKDRIDVFAGNQIVSWGRTDGFNPTNNITPADYFFLTSDPDDQKMSNFMIRTKIRPAHFTDIELIYIPVYRQSVYRYDLFDMGENVNFLDPILPEKTFKNGSLAARVNVELGKAGFSLSWFRGYDPFHGFNTSLIQWADTVPLIDYASTPYLKNTIGADFAITAGSFIIRGEGAYNLTENYESSMHIPFPDLQYVIGLEKDISGVKTIVQYIGKYVPGWEEQHTPVLTDPYNPLAQLQYANDLILYESEFFNRKIFKQEEQTNHAVSMTLSKTFAYETISAGFTAYYNITSEEYMIRPDISWNISDALSAKAGYSYMAGPDKSVFDYSSPVMNGVFVELKASF